MNANQRKKNLIRPTLQLKITLVFLSTSASLMALMAFLTIWLLTDDSAGAVGGSSQVLREVMPVLLKAFLISMAILIPTTLVVGVLATFLVAGPLYRFEIFLNSIRNGERPSDCRLREGDELQDFCKLLNEATRPLREQGGKLKFRNSEESEPAAAA
jgi:hypothetical protein